MAQRDNGRMGSEPGKPYRPRDPAATSRLMSVVRNRNNKQEVRLRKELWRRGYRYRLYVSNLPGRPDIVFAGRKVAVFVDGDFWHGRVYVEKGMRSLNRAFRCGTKDFWIRKILQNIERDQRVTKALATAGWKVIRVWEKDIQRNLLEQATAIEKAVRNQR